jgi:hypothetical protein
MEIVEQIQEWRSRYAGWERNNAANAGELGGDYPWVYNRRAPFTPARRALPMLNLALISSAGAFIDGTQPFDTHAAVDDLQFREIPSEVEPDDLRFTAQGYDPAFVDKDVNSQVPLKRLFEFESNGIIGQVNEVFWSFPGFITDAATFAERKLPQLLERIKRYEVQAVLLIPASRLCHQSVSLAARAIEDSGIPTMTLGVVKDVLESVRPPRGGFYDGQFGCVAGKPDWPEHQRRVLDEALRLIEPMDQAGLRKLVVNLETEVEAARGER